MMNEEQNRAFANWDLWAQVMLDYSIDLQIKQ